MASREPDRAQPDAVREVLAESEARPSEAKLEDFSFWNCERRFSTPLRQKRWGKDMLVEAEYRLRKKKNGRSVVTFCPSAPPNNIAIWWQNQRFSAYGGQQQVAC